MPDVRAQYQRLRRSLISGILDDRAFDELLPAEPQLRSSQYWTPVSVAYRAAELFHDYGARRVLDVGSGPGKFCLAAGASQQALTVVGAERRRNLVEVAQGLAAKLDLANVSFVCGDAFHASWRDFDGLYFFNPFWENMATDESKYDRTVELSAARFMRELRHTNAALRGQPVGTTLISYHGIGVPIPSSYELVASEPSGNDYLRVWLRRRSWEQSWYHVEMEDCVCRVSARSIEVAKNRWRALAEE